MRFDLLPVSTYCWRESGRPLHISTPGKNIRVAVCGAFRWPDGPFLFSHGPKSPNSALFVDMLVQVAKRARRTGKLVILVLDNGSAHKSKRSSEAIEKLSRFVKVVWLPTYTSEQLNDIEGVWGHLKQDYFSRMLVKDRTRFYGAAVNLLAELKRPGALRRMMKPRCREKVRSYLPKVA